MTFWWAIMSCNTAYSLILSKSFSLIQDEFFKLEIYYHIIGWGIPFVLVIIPTAAGKMDYESCSTYCFIASANNYGWIIGCWYVPIGIGLCFGTIGMFFCIYMLTCRARTKRMNVTSWIRSLRLLLCVVIFWIAITLIFAAQIFSSTTLEENNIGVFGYLSCIMGRQTEDYCRSVLLSNTQLQTIYELGMTSTFFMSALGTFLAFFFASSESVLSTITRGTTSTENTGPSYLSQDSSITG